MSLNEEFKGKKILVTGAGRGIGRALCVRLHKYGAVVFALSQNEKNLADLEAECPGIKTIQVDIGDWSATRSKVSELPPLDGLINNAGVHTTENFMAITPESFDRLFNINLKAVVNVSQVVAQKMIDGGGHGSIVNISSSAAVANNMTVCTVYSTTKTALDKLTRLMAVELGPNKIRVNSVNPGPVDTDMFRSAMKSDLQDPNAEVNMPVEYLDRVPLKKLVVDMDDIVNTTLFALSNMTTMMTGQSIVVDGGYTLS